MSTRVLSVLAHLVMADERLRLLRLLYASMMARVGAAPVKLLPERLTLLEVVSVVASSAMAVRSCPAKGGMELAKAVVGAGLRDGSSPASCLSLKFMARA